MTRRTKRRTRGRRVQLPFSAVELAELQRLVFRAFALRHADADAYHAALEEIETFWAESLPDRLRRLEEGQA